MRLLLIVCTEYFQACNSGPYVVASTKWADYIYIYIYDMVIMLSYKKSHNEWAPLCVNGK